MVRTWAVILGIGLGILWIVGLNDPAAPGWLTWLDGVAALCSFAIAAAYPDTVRSRAGRAAAPIVLALGLFALWIVGLATHAVAWLSWWTFAFACAYVLLGIGAGASIRNVPGVRPETEADRERFRRSA